MSNADEFQWRSEITEFTCLEGSPMKCAILKGFPVPALTCDASFLAMCAKDDFRHRRELGRFEYKPSAGPQIHDGLAVGVSP